jgi:hypothetical protein
VLTIHHYGGSRDRWGYDDKFLYAGGRFLWIGSTQSLLDIMAPEDYSTRDANLSTGLIEWTTKVGARTLRRAMRELRAGPAALAAPAAAEAAWTTPGIRLGSHEDVVKGAPGWKGPRDCAATLRALWKGPELWVRAQVQDDQVSAGDGVRLLLPGRKLVAPIASQRTPVPGGYVQVARYRLNALGGGEGLKAFLAGKGADAPGSALLPATLEVVDDEAYPKVLSTNRSGATATGYVRLVATPGFPDLASFNAQDHANGLDEAWEQRYEAEGHS